MVSQTHCFELPAIWLTTEMTASALEIKARWIVFVKFVWSFGHNLVLAQPEWAWIFPYTKAIHMIFTEWSLTHLFMLYDQARILGGIGYHFSQFSKLECWNQSPSNVIISSKAGSVFCDNGRFFLRPNNYSSTQCLFSTIVLMPGAQDEKNTVFKISICS